VPDPNQVLEEMARVMKSGGRVLMLEHVLSRNPRLARLENWMGAHMTRDTVAIIAQSGLLLVSDEKLMLGDIIRQLECRVHSSSEV
jgi:ubiquinone/menaquinone biosynthesis C-methylase UbiE